MAIRKAYIFIVVVVALSMLLSGCESSGCHENRSSIPQATLYASNNLTQKIAVDSISVYGIGQWQDSLLLDCAHNISSFKLPFRNDIDTTRYVIRFDMKALASPQYNDTLTFVYRRHPYFISGDCGVVFNYYIDNMHYTRNLLDSVALVAQEVNNIEQETIRLYYNVAE